MELLSSAWIVGRAVSERNAGTCFLQAQARGGWHFLQAGSLGGTWQGGAWPDFSTVVCLVRTPVPYVTSVPIGYRVLERTKQTQLLTQRDLFPCGHHGQVISVWSLSPLYGEILLLFRCLCGTQVWPTPKIIHLWNQDGLPVPMDL